MSGERLETGVQDTEQLVARPLLGQLDLGGAGALGVIEGHHATEQPRDDPDPEAGEQGPRPPGEPRGCQLLEVAFEAELFVGLVRVRDVEGTAADHDPGVALEVGRKRCADEIVVHQVAVRDAEPVAEGRPFGDGRLALRTRADVEESTGHPGILCVSRARPRGVTRRDNGV